MSRRLARGAADRARSQANKTLKGTTEFPGGERKKREGSACQQASDKAEVGLAESDSETDTSDPGGMPQLFRGPRAPGAGLPKMLRMLLHRRAATRGITPRPVVVARPRVNARGPTLLRNLECKVCTGEPPTLASSRGLSLKERGKTATGRSEVRWPCRGQKNL
jgi:hypothetical protein